MSSVGTPSSVHITRDAPVWGPVVSVAAVVVAIILTAAVNENSWAFRTFAPRWLPPLLFISNRAPGVGRSARPRQYWAFDLLDPEHLVTSFCLNTPLLLALHSFTFVCWAVYVAVDQLYYYGVFAGSSPGPDGTGPYGEWMSFFTNWSITLLGVAGLIAFANTLRRFRHERRARKLHARFLSGGARGADAHEHSGGACYVTSGLGDERPPASAGAGRPGRAPAAERGTGASSGEDDVDGAGRLDKRPRGVDGGPSLPGPGRHPANDIERQTKRQADQAARPAGPSGRGPAAGAYYSGCDRGPPGDQEAAARHLGYKQQCSWSTHPLTRPREKWDWLSISHCLVLQTATSAAFCVSLWYWVGLVAVAKTLFDKRDASTYQAHAGNTLVALLQVVLTRLPFVSYHFQLLLWWGSLYLIFLWIFGASSGIWRYGLNVQWSRSAGAVVLLPVICFVTWLAWWLVAKTRELVGQELTRALSSKALTRSAQQQQGPAAAGCKGGQAPGRVGLVRADELQHAASRLPPRPEFA